jgi:hypothetical protein
MVRTLGCSITAGNFNGFVMFDATYTGNDLFMRAVFDVVAELSAIKTLQARSVNRLGITLEIEVEEQLDEQIVQVLVLSKVIVVMDAFYVPSASESNIQAVAFRKEGDITILYKGDKDDIVLCTLGNVDSLYRDQ